MGSAAMAGPSASSGPQQPFSDSYLAEMPAKKRKVGETCSGSIVCVCVYIQ